MNKKIIKLVSTLVASLCLVTQASQAADSTAGNNSESRLGLQAYTFRAISFFETVDKVHELGLKYIEMYPGQKLMPGSATKTGTAMTPEELAKLKAKLKEAGVKLVSFGVSPIPTNEAAARDYFIWAKNLGIEVLVTESTPTKMMDQLSGEFGIKVAIHNHPETWPPEAVIAAIQDLSTNIGDCADVGHWRRAGLDTVATLKLFHGRVIHTHFKDVAPAENPNPNASIYEKIHDVPWGTGECNVAGMMAELKKEGYHGYYIIEYETGTIDELMRDLPKCIKYFNQTAAELSK